MITTILTVGFYRKTFLLRAKLVRFTAFNLQIAPAISFSKLTPISNDTYHVILQSVGHTLFALHIFLKIDILLVIDQSSCQWNAPSGYDSPVAPI